MRPKDFLLVVVLILIALAGYHFLFAAEQPVTDDGAGYEASLPLDAGEGTAEPGLAGRGLERRLALLERRMATLAAQEGGSGGSGGGSLTSAGDEWSDEELASLRAGLVKVQELQRRDAAAAHYRAMVQGLLPKQEEALREKLAQRLVQYTADLRELQPARRPAGLPPKEKEALQKAASKLRAHLEVDVRALLPTEDADTLLKAVPQGRPPGAPKPRPAPFVRRPANTKDDLPGGGR